MIVDLLTDLLRANLGAGVAIVLVAALRRLARRTFGARVAYLMWTAPVIAAAAVFIPPAYSPVATMTPMMQDVLAVAGGVVEIGGGAAAIPPSALFGLWVTGAAAAAGLLFRRQALYGAAIARGEAGPAVVGALRPRIVTPDDFETRFNAAERDVILAHEMAHLRSGDARINALAAAALCACWFNPLVHVAVYLMRLDQELACDATVLDSFPKARRLYAEVLLKTQLAAQPLPFGCHWPAAAEHPLKERIVMLSFPRPARGRRLAGIAMVALVCTSAAAAVWAAQPTLSKPAAPAMPLSTLRGAPVAAAAPLASRVPKATIPTRATLAVAQGASATPRMPREPAVIPDWSRRPDGADVAWAYPPAAKASNLEGRATIACLVEEQGRLGKCQVINEAPIDAGFGQAALALTGQFQMKPVDRNGRPTRGAEVRIPIRFMLPAAAT